MITKPGGVIYYPKPMVFSGANSSCLVGQLSKSLQRVNANAPQSHPVAAWVKMSLRLIREGYTEKFGQAIKKRLAKKARKNV